MDSRSRLVKEGSIASVEDIYLHSLPIKEYQIVDALFPAGNLKDDVMKIMPVQKQTSAGQRTRFVCYVAVGDSNGHIGLGKKAAKEVRSKRRASFLLDSDLWKLHMQRTGAASAGRSDPQIIQENDPKISLR